MSRTCPELPNNILTLDVAYLERALFTTGERGVMRDRKTGRARLPESLLSLSGLLHSLGIEPPCVLHNAGNDAFMTLVAFQWMMDPVGAARMMPMGPGMGMRMGIGNGTGKGEVYVKRAATVAARFFRPLGGIQHPDPGTKGNGKEDLLQKTTIGSRSGSGADEMGMNVSMKRASMFSTLTSPLSASADKSKKRVSGGSTSGSGSGFANAWWSPSTIVPGQRRQSVMEKRRSVGGSEMLF